ncbi:MAG: hypothetical protein K0T99_02520 [Alphaproteobacteria bacterium]|nr:hypothetical protein [Alphaproteobacteria bacterium]
MKEYGGYFQFESFEKEGKEFHSSAIKLNLARNAISYLCIVNDYKILHVPRYICESVKVALDKENIKYCLYDLNYDFSPKLSKEDIEESEAVLYPNYFGVHALKSAEVKQKYKNVILDNTQAFFSLTHSANAVYSARKFFGVPDGAYAYSVSKKRISLDQDYSYMRMLPLFKRLELGANPGYKESLESEALLNEQPMRAMSKTTEFLLGNIDYNFCKDRRRKNFHILHENLGRINELSLHFSKEDVPMVYPLLISKKTLRNHLLEKNIYIPQWWRSVMLKASKSSFEYYLSRYLIPLPIDHRYTEEDMRFIAGNII